jgi:DNA-binding transcriptional regulator YiaG
VRQFLKNLPISFPQECRGEGSSKKVISLARLRLHLAIGAVVAFPQHSETSRMSVVFAERQDCLGAPARNAGDRFTAGPSEWHRGSVNELRQLRRNADLSQRQFAELLDVPVNTFRMWDSGLRIAPMPIAKRAREIMVTRAKERELLSLDQLARELGVHLRTLQAAARTGRLDAHFTVRSVFGRPIRFASRAAGQRFLATHYRRFSGQQTCPLPIPTILNDYDNNSATFVSGCE